MRETDKDYVKAVRLVVRNEIIVAGVGIGMGVVLITLALVSAFGG